MSLHGSLATPKMPFTLRLITAVLRPMLPLAAFFQVFLYYSGDGTWKALPDIYNGTQFYDRFSTGGFEIYYGNVDGTTPSPLSGTWTFRTVVIAPSQKQAHPNTNWRNYDEIMKVANESKAVVSTTTVSQ
jgi:hypothetical protein